MKRSNRHPRRRVLTMMMFGLLGAAGSSNADSSQAKETGVSCKQETRLIAVWPVAPKASQFASFEKRAVTVCDGKVVSTAVSSPIRQAKE
jgi:hypothetical protein